MRYLRSTTARALLSVLAILALAMALPFILRAVAPDWWQSKQVYQYEAGQVADAADYAAANQGQLKNMAIAAYEHFVEKLASFPDGIGPMTPPPDPNSPESPTNRAGTGWRLRTLVSQWIVLNPEGIPLRQDMNPDGTPADPVNYSVTGTGPRQIAPAAGTHNDFAAINQGQLKAVAAPFYARLDEIYLPFGGIPPEWKPWTDAAGDDSSFAMASLGQLKNVFAFDLDRDSDGDGWSDLYEITHAYTGSNPAGVSPNPFDSDSDDDGIPDGQETSSNPYLADTDGDGFKDGEDRWPVDGRRGDYIPPKFYAVTDLSAYVPEAIREDFVGTAVTIDPATQEVGFAGDANGRTYSYSFVDGVATEVENFKTTVQEPEVLTLTTGTAYVSEWVFTEEGGPWVTPDGEMVMNARHRDHYVANVNNEPVLDEGDHYDTIATGAEAEVTAAASKWPKPAGVLEHRNVALSQNGTKRLEKIVYSVEIGTQENPEWATRYAWEVNEVEVAAVTTQHSTSNPMTVMYDCRGINDAGMFIVRKSVMDEEGNWIEDPETPWLYYDPADGALHEAPKGLVAINNQAQGVGWDHYPDVSPPPDLTLEEAEQWDTGAYFWQAARGASQHVKMPLEDLLKWDDKPPGVKDDYDRYFARNISEEYPTAGSQVRSMVAVTLTDADPSTAGISVGGEVFQIGIPYSIVVQFETLRTEPHPDLGEWMTVDGSILANPELLITELQHSRPINSDGEDARIGPLFAVGQTGPAVSLGVPPPGADDSNTAPLLITPIHFVAKNIYRGFDPPIQGDRHLQNGLFDQQLNPAEWWTVADYEPDAVRTALSNLPANIGTLVTQSRTDTEIKYFNPPNGSSPPRAAVTQSPAGSIGKLSVESGGVGDGVLGEVSEGVLRWVTANTYFKLTNASPPSGNNGDRVTTHLEFRRPVYNANGQVSGMIGVPFASLSVDVLPQRLVPIGIWYLHDGDPATNDAPSLAPYNFRNASAIIARLNRTFWQARIMFMPVFMDPDGDPECRSLAMPGYGGGKGVLNLTDSLLCREVHDFVHTQGGAPALNIVIVRNVPRDAKSIYGVVHPQFRTTAFLQTSTIEAAISSTANAGIAGSQEAYIDDHLTVAAHEVGHILGLSVHDLFNGEPPGKQHDIGPHPVRYYNSDGSAAEPNHWQVIPPIAVDFSWKLVPWEESSGLVTLRAGGIVQMKRRLQLPLMVKGGIPTDGISLPDRPKMGVVQRSLWIRHEDWQQANAVAKGFGVR